MMNADTSLQQLPDTNDLGQSFVRALQPGQSLFREAVNLMLFCRSRKIHCCQRIGHL